ncbi:zinc ribbon domain-containing protein [Christiangramia sp.]|uniref:zinc ribbon domain-containing protein n=1 Tax=Christiangramia sp. TaxID=1931228 RepID=UPI00262C91C7|nr:zinc ribbon domain-containing protein [Christiangramia sp.]
MSVIQVVAALGMIPLFASRTFLPAFLTGIFLTYPNLFPGMEGVDTVSDGNMLTKTWVLVTLGILSFFEILADKNPDIRSLMNNAVTYFKPASYLLVSLGLIDNSSLQILNEVQLAGFDPMWILFAFGMLAVHWLASLRRDFIEFLEDIDEDDNLFIGKIISWMEDSMVFFGFILLIWSGILMVILYAGLIALFVYIRKRQEKKLEEQEVECSHCGERNMPFAIKCFNCGTKQSRVHQIGIFGQKKDGLISNVKEHQINLISHRKCPSCGNKLQSREVFQKCEYCEEKLFNEPSLKTFTRSIDKKFYKIAGISFLLGFIPIVGFVISAVMANIYLFSPYRKYIPKGGSFITKMFIKFLTLLFFIFGVAFGFIAAPVYCIIRYYIWKERFKSQIPARSELKVS